MKKILTIVMIMAIILTSSVMAFSLTESVVPAAPSSGSVETKVVKVLGVIQWIGYIVAIGMLIWVGIKYVTSGAGEKAKAKETLIPIVVGAVLIAGATWIATAVFSMVE